MNIKYTYLEKNRLKIILNYVDTEIIILIYNLNIKNLTHGNIVIKNNIINKKNCLKKYNTTIYNSVGKIISNSNYIFNNDKLLKENINTYYYNEDGSYTITLSRNNYKLSINFIDSNKHIIPISVLHKYYFQPINSIIYKKFFNFNTIKLKKENSKKKCIAYFSNLYKLKDIKYIPIYIPSIIFYNVPKSLYDIIFIN